MQADVLTTENTGQGDPCGLIRTAFLVIAKGRNIFEQLDVLSIHKEIYLSRVFYNAYNCLKKIVGKRFRSHTKSFTCRPSALERNVPSESFFPILTLSLSRCMTQ